MGEWILVEDDEPSEGEQYLITGHREGTDDRYVALATYSEEKFYDEDEEHEYLNVTHYCVVPDTEDLDEE